MDCACAEGGPGERNPGTASALGPGEAAAAGVRSGGALVFDLNYPEHTTPDEAGALCRQLTMSFAANRRAARPFPLLVVGGVGVPESDNAADVAASDSSEAGVSAGDVLPLIRMLSASNWWTCPGVYRTGSAVPWVGLPGEVVYLTADSPNVLEDLPAGGDAAPGPSTVYVVGGIVDRVEKPGLSYQRAVAAGLRTARLPLEKFLQLRSSGKKAQGSGCRRADDITTLAVVQMLLLFRENGGKWGDAISRCPALRCAPLRKYVQWLPPYHELNNAKRQDVFAQPATRTEDGEDKRANKRKASANRSKNDQVITLECIKTCEACGAGFASRNKLFRHLSQCTSVDATRKSQDQLAHKAHRPVTQCDHC